MLRWTVNFIQAKHNFSLSLGSYDFLGLNHYTTSMTQASTGPDWAGDNNVTTFRDDSWEGSASSWLNVVPWG